MQEELDEKIDVEMVPELPDVEEEVPIVEVLDQEKEDLDVEVSEEPFIQEIPAAIEE